MRNCGSRLKNGRMGVFPEMKNAVFECFPTVSRLFPAFPASVSRSVSRVFPPLIKGETRETVTGNTRDRIGVEERMDKISAQVDALIRALHRYLDWLQRRARLAEAQRTKRAKPQPKP